MKIIRLRALLIQKSIKPTNSFSTAFSPFESFVNSEEYQTTLPEYTTDNRFESFVNSEEYQTEY